MTLLIDIQEEQALGPYDITALPWRTLEDIHSHLEGKIADLGEELPVTEAALYLRIQRLRSKADSGTTSVAFPIHMNDYPTFDDIGLDYDTLQASDEELDDIAVWLSEQFGTTHEPQQESQG